MRTTLDSTQIPVHIKKGVQKSIVFCFPTFFGGFFVDLASKLFLV